MNPNQLGFQTEALKGIPHLVKCRVLRLENDKPMVNIPVLCMKELQELWRFCGETAYAMRSDIKEVLAKFLKGKQLSIPAHLDSVPLQKQYMQAMDALMLSTIREAVKRGKLYDGDYDKESGENPPPCPMILVIDK